MHNADLGGNQCISPTQVTEFGNVPVPLPVPFNRAKSLMSTDYHASLKIGWNDNDTSDVPQSTIIGIL